ncbi:hypothetical protein IWQ56_000505 [Coemansia nantahalensis]|nr:hypothetical protein IWQ56_000505 [Coemansia nantahalensis]
MDTAERGTKQTKDVSRRDTAAGEWGVEEAAGTGLPTDGAQVSLLQDVSERCSAHPGSRNEMWCETCAAAICEHCMLSTAHQGHAVAKLSAAYDDAFEAIEAMQVALVRSRNEARQRGTLLDAARAGLSESCAAAQDALESELERRAEALADAFARTQATLDARMGGCTEWRGVLGETLQTVHGLVDELPPAQLVASRARILALLGASEKARPADWWAPLPRVDGLATLVQPEARSATLRVPRVMELGRKRGHVRVVGRPLAAHGLTWHAEARRGSGPLGDPCLLVAVSCAEGCADAAIAASVHVVAPDEATGRAAVASALDLLRPPGAHEPDPQPQRRLFWQETRTHVWARQAPCELLVCSLAELESAGALDSDGAVTLRFGVQPASFRDLARAQQDRIAALERQLDELQLRQRPPASPADGKPQPRTGQQYRIAAATTAQPIA